MKINIVLSGYPKRWYRYFWPVWLNCITYKMDIVDRPDTPKVYRWLFWHIAIRQ